MSEWKVIQLRDISSDISYGYTASASSENVGPKFLRITDITSGRINWKTVPYCKISEKDFKKYQLGIGDIVIARTGATTGYNAIIKTNIDAVYASYLIRFQIDRKVADPFFVGHILQSNNFQDYVDAIAGGSAQPGANAQQLADFEFLLPPLPEQSAIAEVLSSLDDKIDLLHRQNKTLEQLAETLFRQWFVEEADESWEYGTINDVVSIKGGTTPSTTENKYWDGDIHWTSPRDLSNTTSIFLFDTSRKITEEGLKQISSGLLPVGTLLLSSRAPIGYLALTEIPVAINQGYIAIICDKIVSNYFMFLWCKANMDTIENAGNGSVFQEISKSAFRTLEFLIPPQEKLRHFDTEIEPVFQKIKSNTQQIRTLTQLRDTLLPKLMSGEVKIKV